MCADGCMSTFGLLFVRMFVAFSVSNISQSCTITRVTHLHSTQRIYPLFVQKMSCDSVDSISFHLLSLPIVHSFVATEICMNASDSILKLYWSLINYVVHSNKWNHDTHLYDSFAVFVVICSIEKTILCYWKKGERRIILHSNATSRKRTTRLLNVYIIAYLWGGAWIYTCK